MDFFVCECVCRVGVGKKKSQFFSWHDFRKTTPPVLLNRPFPPRAHTSENDLCLNQMHESSPSPRGLELGIALCWDSAAAWFNSALPAFPGPKPKPFRLYFFPTRYPAGNAEPQVFGRSQILPTSLCLGDLTSFIIRPFPIKKKQN